MLKPKQKRNNRSNFVEYLTHYLGGKTKKDYIQAYIPYVSVSPSPWSQRKRKCQSQYKSEDQPMSVDVKVLSTYIIAREEDVYPKSSIFLHSRPSFINEKVQSQYQT